MGTDSKSQVLNFESPESAIKRSKKKRKREKEKTDDAAVQVPSDHPAINSQLMEQLPVNVKIEVVPDEVDKTAPILGYFPSGYNPCKSKVSSYNQEPDQEPNPQASAPPQPSVKLYRNAQRVKIEKGPDGNEKRKTSEKLELVVSPNNASSTVEFVGTSYKGEAVAAQLCTYALGVLDKETQRLRILPIAGNKIFRLEPKVHKFDTADKETSGLENSALTGEQKADKSRQYGTKKSMNQEKKLRALKQGDDPEAQKHLGEKLEIATVNKEALESSSAHLARNIPPYNPSAETPQEAYPLNLIIRTEEWGSLQDIYQILRRGEMVASNDYPSFVCNRIHKLREIQDEEEKKRQCSIFTYITHLVKFKDQHSLDGDPSAKQHTFPSIIRQRFWEMFNPERRRLSNDNLSLLISYVLVLTLYADDFRTDAADIAKDLNFSTLKLRKHFENLGCKYQHRPGTVSSIYTLPTPLQFPQLRDNRRQKRAR